MKATILLGLIACAASLADVGGDAPLASIDLSTQAGVTQVQGQWRYRDAELRETRFRLPGSDGQPNGAVTATHVIEPAAGVANFDDSAWAAIDPNTLSQRRGTGHVSFNWYRIKVTVPQRVGGVDVSGTTLMLAARLDDYAEVWVDGELDRSYGQSGGSVVAGWNALNRLVIGRHVRPGQKIELAIFGMNGPISDAPTNYIYIREARLEFAKGEPGPVAVAAHEVNIRVERDDPAIDAIVPANAKLFKLAEGFDFTEGPVWVRGGDFLLFSDPNRNRIYRYSSAGELSVYRDHSGYDGEDIAEYHQPGSNGLTLDAQGRLTINEHGRRRVTRVESGGRISVLADRYHGKRLNSPNDLVYRSDGAVYFTDPPFGLPKVYDDPRKELPFSGVYRAKNGRVELLTKEFKGPNGIAFSPDEHYLYVGNWDPNAKVVKRYAVKQDGRLERGEPFIDLTAAIPGEEALDGIKVDVRGNLYLSAPGGVWIFNSAGKHLGTITAPRPVHNFAWGGRDGNELYLCARSALYRVPLLIAGVRP